MGLRIEQASAVLDWRREVEAMSRWRSPGWFSAWRPKVGERVFVIDANRAAEVLVELPGDRFEVEPELRVNVLQPDNAREVYHLSELRPEHPRD